MKRSRYSARVRVLWFTVSPELHFIIVTAGLLAGAFVVTIGITYFTRSLQ